MNGDQHVADAIPSKTGMAVISRPAAELYSQAQAARSQARLLAGRLQAAQQTTAETFQLIVAAWDRARQLRERQSAAGTRMLRYSVTARLQAQLASMPAIEQAKGIVMAQSGWAEDQALDALRRASQRENIKMRDLAARIVAETVRTAPAEPQPDPAPAAGPAPGEGSHAKIVSAIAAAAARRLDRAADG